MGFVHQLPTRTQRTLEADAVAAGYDVYFDDVSGGLTIKGSDVAVELTGEGYGLDLLVDCTMRPALSLREIRDRLGL